MAATLVPPPPVSAVVPRAPDRWAWFRRHSPELLLISLSITFAEFLTGSTPVALIFFSPLSLPFLLGLYGAGVLLVREISVRRSLGWGSILLLGVAYGISEEAIGTKTFFDPNEVHLLGVYGHAFGVNWIWAIQLSIFHAIFSIALPILVVGLWFPATRGRLFLTDRGLWTTAATFALTVLVMFAAFDRSYDVAPGLMAVALATAAACVGLAFGLDRSAFRSPAPSRSAPSRVALVAGGFVWGFFALNWLGPSLVPAPAVLGLLIVGWTVALGLVLQRLLGASPGGTALWGLTVGLLSFLLALATGWAIAGDWGLVVVVPVTLFLLVRLRTKLVRGEAPLRRLAPPEAPRADGIT